jgi:two-component system alkaline phosphatase synthesis response regulator PhoP
MEKILVVEDEPAVAMGLTYTLAAANYSVRLAETGAEALAKVTADRPDLIILDLRLPDIDGVEICRNLRAQDFRQPILMLTARDSTHDKVIGLEAGADDYLTKPYELEELLARVQALLRRVQRLSPPAATLHIGPFELDLAQQRVTRDEQEIALTATEFKLLCHLASAPGRVFSRDELIEAVWGYQDYFGDPRTVDVHIRHLRLKLEDDPTEPDTILTVRGAGYRLATGAG